MSSTGSGTLARIARAVDALPLVDHHAHSAFAAMPERRRFENLLNEGDTEPLPAWLDAFDGQLGFALRRWCAPLLELEPHAQPDAYWGRRIELGDAEVTTRMLRAAGVSDWLIDTGFATGELLSLPAFAVAAGAPAERVREVLRLEPLAERLIAEGPDGFAERFRAALAAEIAARRIIGLKSVIAYRSGFAVDYTVPADAAVDAAAARWAASLADGAAHRLVDPTLLVFLLYAATGTGLPLQLHVGFGDRDLDLDKVDPLLLTPFLRTPEARRADILLLHCYPFERQAGYLASAFSNVYLDVGLAANHLGAASESLIARSLELAPFAKVLYSSDAWGPAELHYLGARLWRTGMARVLARWVDAGDWAEADAIRVARLIASENARRVYRL